ncbi:protealysin inhibitor emfourin [Salinicola salarius]|uniref:protealysin inhibitor emfourin n=1 Tax=Salinicola salarius TaxID=430457 RepID=UPI000DA12B13|nr:protealysin inhibitor emfourin [Salinicola salarius]
MSDSAGLELEPTSVLLVTREGGFVVTPGLSAPRRIDCRELTERQRLRLQTVLEELDHRRGDLPAAGADRRSFRVTLTMPSGRAEKEWELEESAAPRSLIVLWKRGAQGLDESDD